MCIIVQKEKVASFPATPEPPLWGAYANTGRYGP